MGCPVVSLATTQAHLDAQEVSKRQWGELDKLLVASLCLISKRNNVSVPLPSITFLGFLRSQYTNRRGQGLYGMVLPSGRGVGCLTTPGRLVATHDGTNIFFLKPFNAISCRKWSFRFLVGNAWHWQCGPKHISTWGSRNTTEIKSTSA